MSKITTEDCKKYLAEKFPDLQSKDWKRIKKYKDDNNYWCRDFDHKSGATAIIIEINDNIHLKDSASSVAVRNDIVIKDPNKVLYYKKFDENLLKAGRKIVKKYTTYDEDELEITADMKGYEAIPNSIVFFFTGEYPPETKITKEIASYMDFSIFFGPVTSDSFDQHMTTLIGDLLPDNYSEECECEFVPYYDNDDNALTIKEIMQELLDRGFIYDSKNCDLKNYFSDYSLVPKIFKSPVVDESLLDSIISIVKKDDSKELERLINENKISIDCSIKSSNILNYCYKNDKKSCFSLLLKYIPNLMKYNSGKKHIFNVIKYEYKDQEHIKKYLTIIFNEAKIDFGNSKDYLYLNDLLSAFTVYHDLRMTVYNSGFKQALYSIKKFLKPNQFGEVVLFWVLAYRQAADDLELMNLALNFIDEYKQEAITESIEIKLHTGTEYHMPVSEIIINKLIQYNLKVGKWSLNEFFKIQLKRCQDFDMEIYYTDVDGLRKTYNVYSKDIKSYWINQLGKLGEI